ncbi:hypothetical protein PGIGA_G00135940 [Pangasianodon gigas]|uniref:Uncharacterized protein n=1 Tax=Pangasianodon gigas TaxID=30993 RepID=A0ACC5XKV9_PANGG|nr:hypothetical protein [Pangasianodon gigas]
MCEITASVRSEGIRCVTVKPGRLECFRAGKKPRPGNLTGGCAAVAERFPNMSHRQTQVSSDKRVCVTPVLVWESAGDDGELIPTPCPFMGSTGKSRTARIVVDNFREMQHGSTNIASLSCVNFSDRNIHTAVFKHG